MWNFTGGWPCLRKSIRCRPNGDLLQKFGADEVDEDEKSDATGDRQRRRHEAEPRAGRRERQDHRGGEREER